VTIEEKLSIGPYKFKYEVSDNVTLKGNEEIKSINQILFDASPEFDYNTTKWYMPVEKEGQLRNVSLEIINRISWHGGWPFYEVRHPDGKHFYAAEFYLLKG